MRGVEDKSDCFQNLRAASTLTLSPGTPVRSIGSFVTQVSPRRKISHHEMRYLCHTAEEEHIVDQTTHEGVSNA